MSDVYLGFSLFWNGLCPIRERIVESLASSLPAMWITHSLCSYVWKRQRVLYYSPGATETDQIPPNTTAQLHISLTAFRGPKYRLVRYSYHSKTSHLGHWENPVSASQKLFRRLMNSFVCAAELLSVCAHYIRIIKNLSTFYWLGFLYCSQFISWWRIH